MKNLNTFFSILKLYVHVLGEKGEDVGPNLDFDPKLLILDREPWDQLIMDPRESGSGTLTLSVLGSP